MEEEEIEVVLKTKNMFGFEKISKYNQIDK